MVGEKGSQLMEGFEIQEPLMAKEAAADRQVMVAKLLEGFRQHLQERTDHFLGYPSNLGFDYSPLTQFLRFSLNNFGDPFVETNYGVNSRQFEVAVLDWFTRLWDLQKGEHWGYITSGGSEGNMYGLLVGRELFPDGILYASRESHYSILKVARMYRIEYVKIDTLVSGEMNYADFKSKLLQNSGRPAIVNVTIGTTMKGAVDDLDKIIETLENCGFRDRFYIHCDGALSGPMMPFVKQAPKVTFKKPIGSISISGHKFIGCPMPCGVVITRLAHAKLLSTNIEYIASRDATITGSRNGHAPIYLWYALNKKGYRGIREDVQRCQENAHFLVDRLKEAGVSAYWNALSNTVVFERPNDETFVRKWQIACEGKIAHVVVMPHITAEKLDKFVEELRERRVCWHQDVVPCVAADIGRENCFCDLHNKNPRIGKSFTNDRGTFSNFMMHG